MREYDANIVHLDQHVNAVQKLSDLCVTVLFAIEEVDDGVYHYDIRLMKRDLITERLYVCILHEVLSQPVTDDQVVVTNSCEIIVGGEPSVVQINPALKELSDYLCLKPDNL